MFSLSDECLMELITTQYVPILTCDYCNCSINNECKWLVNVCFNRAIRRVFKYKDNESVRDIMVWIQDTSYGFVFHKS